MYLQHILSLHFVCLHDTKVAVYCISSWHHQHLCVLLDQYVSLGHLLHNGYNLYQKTVNISARCNITFLISDTIHCLPFHRMFSKHGCHNCSRLLNIALLYINLLKPTGHVMHHQFNIQQLYALPTLYLCVLYLSENKQRLVPLTA